MSRIMTDIKKYGTSYAVSYVDGQILTEMKKQKLIEEANKEVKKK